ncbi:MAG: polysaccharide deacetylase family protein [Candidatus Omnitrophica bacterium]|nr:polysaccharide deacetylase family protein [Candidatus Omnitrophota bacterium]
MTFKIVKVTSMLFILFLLLILGFGLFLRYIYINPVLMYHYIVDTDLAKKDKRIVTPQTFEQQMHFLKVNDYNVISLEEFAKFLKHKKRIPRNTVVLTFDDGYLDNYENAYPILKKYDLKATMFVIVDSLSNPNFMTKEQIKEMSNSGLITIGSHTLGERHLPSIADEDELKKEIYDSKKKLEAILNKPVNCFSYPIGGFNKKIRQMVIDAGYTVAVSTSPGLCYSNDDPFAIKRVRISENSKNLFVFWFESSGLYKGILEIRKDYETRRKNKDGKK